MNIREKLYFKLLPFFLALFFGMMIFGIVFDPGVISKPAWIPIQITALAGIAVYAIVVLYIWRFIKKRLEKSAATRKTEHIFLSVFFIVLTLLQIVFLVSINIPMKEQCLTYAGGRDFCVWDFNIIASGAAGSVNDDIDAGTIDYLHRHQNNIPVFYLLRAVFKVASSVGITNFQAVGNVLNLISINTSILLLYFLARKLFGVKKAMFTLLATAFVLPLVLLYTPFFYTDTLSLVFPLAIIYVYLKLREVKKINYFIMLSIALALLAFAGSMIKMSVIITLIAVAIDAIIRLNKHNLKRTVAAGFTVLAILTPAFIGYAAFANTHIHSKANSASIITPWTHYIMMGLGGNGMYSTSDDLATTSLTTQAVAMNFNAKAIVDRLKGHGILYPYFLYQKGLATWTDGSYESPYRLANTYVVTKDFKPTALQNAVTNRDAYPLTFSNYLQSIQVLLLFGMFIGAIKIYQNRKTMLSVIGLAIFGLVGFLMIWETNSRYLVNYLPLLILFAAPTWWKIATTVPKHLDAWYLSTRKRILHY